jgi:glycine cleavage system transcriptional repressor
LPTPPKRAMISPSEANRNMVQGRHVLSVSGEDRPGILDDVSKFILEHGASIEDVKMTNLGGRVSMLTLVAADTETAGAIGRNLCGFKQRAALHADIAAAVHTHADHDGHEHVLVVRTGHSTEIFRKISHLLRAVGVNVDEVSTPHVDDDLLMRLTFRLRRDFPVTNLREYLDQLLAPLKIGWELRTQ